MQMLLLSANDDIQTLETFRSQAKVVRRCGSSTAALTATKIELMMDAAIEELSNIRRSNATEEQADLVLAAEPAAPREDGK